MALFGIRAAIKKTVTALVGQPDEVAGKPVPPRTAPKPPAKASAPAVPASPSPEAQAAAAPTIAETEAPAPPAKPVVEEPAEVSAAAPSKPKMDPTDDTAGPMLSYDEVWELLDDMVRPALQGDGGDITLIKVEENDVHVRLTGACSTCPSSIMTMKMGVEALLREEFPHMRELVQHES